MVRRRDLRRRLRVLPGQRGRRRRPKHVNLLDRLDIHRDEVLRSATDLRVPFTNNGSERDIRPTKSG